MLAAMDRVRGDFRAAAMTGRVDFSRDDSGALSGLFSHFTYRVAPERLVRLRGQLAAVFDELHAEGNSAAEDAVDVTLFTLLYGVGPAPAVDAAPASAPTSAPASALPPAMRLPERRRAGHGIVNAGRTVGAMVHDD